MKTACWRLLGALTVVLFAFAADSAPCDPTARNVKLYCRSPTYWNNYDISCTYALAHVIANVIADLNSRSATNGNMKLCFGQDPPDADTGVILDTDPAWNSSASFADLNLYMLIGMNFWDNYLPYFTDGQAVLLTTALASGTLKRLMIYDAYAANYNLQANYPGIDLSLCSGGQSQLPDDHYDIVGLQSAFSTADPNLTESGFPVTTLGSEYNSVEGATMHAGPAAFGHCVLDAVAATTTCDPVVYFAAYNGAAVLPVGFTYCLGTGVVFYSTQPLDLYGVYGLPYFKIFEPTLSTLLGPAPAVREPVCPANVFVSRAWLPPNGKMTQVDITAVSYPNGTVPAEDTIIITAVDFADTTQGAHPTYPLAIYTTEAQNPATVHLRAERNGNGPGRVYRITYTATTQQTSMPPKSCIGQAYVCIPHDASVAEATNITMINLAHENKLCPGPQSITTWMPAIGTASAHRIDKP